MVRVVGGMVVALSLTGTAMAQDTVTWKDDVHGWSVAIDRTIADSCFIISGFEDDLFLRFQFNATQKNVQFIVANVNWDSLKTGEDYDLEVAFGDMDAWTGMAKGHRWSDILPSLVLSVPMEDQQASHFMREFTGMGSVRISHAGAEIANLALHGASEAVDSMLECQATMADANRKKSAGRDPFAPQSDPI